MKIRKAESWRGKEKHLSEVKDRSKDGARCVLREWDRCASPQTGLPSHFVFAVMKRSREAQR